MNRSLGSRFLTMNDRSNNWIVLETSLGSTKKINRKNSPITNKTRNIWKYEFRPIFSSLWVSQTCSTVDSIRKDLKLTLKLNFLFRFWSLAQLAHLERQYFSLKSFCFDSDKILNDSKSDFLKERYSVRKIYFISQNTTSQNSLKHHLQQKNTEGFGIFWYSDKNLKRLWT